MEEFLKSCISKYQELTGCKNLPKADTPFIDEVKADKEYFALQYEIEDAKAKNSSISEKSEEVGELKPIAARVIMKLFYAARLARWDLLRAIGMLATRITKWSKWDDKRLHRLMCYVQTTLQLRMRSWRSTKDTNFTHDLYVDADFAGDAKDSKSTNGVYQQLAGNSSRGQVSAVSKKQSCVSHSTPEAEIVAADHGIRVEALPALDLVELVLGRKARVRVHEDNETAALAIRNGKSPAMRYLHRTHRVSVSWLHDLERNKTIETLNCDTELQKADIFTKPFNEANKWNTRLVEIGIWYPDVSSAEFVAVAKVKPNKNTSAQASPVNASALPSIAKRSVEPNVVRNVPFEIPKNKRLIIKFCCGPDSKLGQTSKIKEASDCVVIRITEEHDVTTEKGFEFVNHLIDLCIGSRTMLMAAMPCTGGSMWMNINKRRPGGEARLRKHLSTFRKIWKTFVHCARKLAAKGGTIVNEWPRSCRYWKWPEVVRFFDELDMQFVDFDGCMLGLTGRKGNLIKKPR